MIRALINRARSYWTTPILLSAYLSVGVLFSHLQQIGVYSERGGGELLTWFSRLHDDNKVPSDLATVISSSIALLVFACCLNIFHRAKHWDLKQILKYGTRCMLVLLFVSQLTFSSAMRVPYEALFCLVTIGGALVFKGIGNSDDISPKKRNDCRSLLKFLVPLSIGLPIITGGVGAVSNFYAGEQEVIRLQIYRHFNLAGYFIFGAVTFLIYPLLQVLLTNSADTGPMEE